MSYQLLLLLICILAPIYLNRNNFGGPAQKVMGFWLPKAVIIGGLCIILGIFFWIAVNVVLLKFK
ncbi:hypothetical protein A2954_00450 [Candidatus Roizmanbacteria bacterium RIFCSPLOWO2_01_FULL_37_12]|uniref:Uncharacterized protein n=1 Tax=Candidatus Roizmanbacteria bacterium RIFCSPLOWO2_01_FULL_37_12 TaxID=1802056 RepID=A0A1F7ICV7_9BACT|nr:MAG: hypothetical protein A2768_00085 [Candidatus Roizmanbacteria bacterium RIFCSPHIGHO2_01_FULL_37_16]OGK41208.1 MAG: hypothetical protein A2954_00450 [Candidatus Roizmanbacteria bacterium RIFCSPLOWO2_01_FULL_37_12]